MFRNSVGFQHGQVPAASASVDANSNVKAGGPVTTVDHLDHVVTRLPELALVVPVGADLVEQE